LKHLSEAQVQEVFQFIPPRNVFNVKLKSENNSEINGVYIESFIEPGKLGFQNLRSNINKVRNAMECARRLGAKIVTLGGFTSIVLEGNIPSCSNYETRFSTGNTLTAAFIIKGIEKAAEKFNIDLRSSNLLIIGATGDIGHACAGYFKGKMKKLLLSARNVSLLEKLANELISQNIEVAYSTTLEELIPEADIVLSVASSFDIKIRNYKKGVLICDAGYPKNFEAGIEYNKDVNLFHGGMGQVINGYEFIPDYSKSFYKFPVENVLHGCILEVMVLAFEKIYEPYSHGRGNITVEAINKIFNLGLKHGITLAPLYNSSGRLK
jgi:fatty aldehyde-generating acyl-ACP reductase